MVDTVMRPSPSRAEMTTPPKMDTNCTTLSLITTVTGNGSQLLPRTDNCLHPKEAQPQSHALATSINYILTSSAWSVEGALNWRCFPLLPSHSFAWQAGV
jgi:hypothetical protein